MDSISSVRGPLCPGGVILICEIGGTTCDKRGNALYTGTDPNTGAGHAFDPYKDVPAGGCDGQKPASWRVPLALQIVPALILGIGMM